MAVKVCKKCNEIQDDSSICYRCEHCRIEYVDMFLDYDGVYILEEYLRGQEFTKNGLKISEYIDKAIVVVDESTVGTYQVYVKYDMFTPPEVLLSKDFDVKMFEGCRDVMPLKYMIKMAVKMYIDFLHGKGDYTDLRKKLDIILKVHEKLCVGDFDYLL